MLPIILVIIFIILSLLHFNWAFGGKFGFEASLPTNESGEIILSPKKIDCAIVGIALATCGLFYLVISGLISFNIPAWIIESGGWIIPIVFLLRAIGEFKYVGFFKRVKTTEFAKLDTQFFSPLCLFIGTLGIVIQLSH